MSAQLIVHADDFGLSKPVNEGILAAHLQGVLTSTSIMAVGHAYEDAVRIAREYPALDIGAHLTLVEERPLCKAAEIGSLLQEDGTFVTNAQAFLIRVMTDRIDVRHVRKELDAQLSKIFDSGLTPSHIDSHQHVHVIPAIRREVIALAEKYGIKWVRRPGIHVRPYMFRQPALYKRLAQMIVLDLFCRAGSWGNLKSADVFSGFFHGGQMDTDNLRSLLSTLPKRGVCEVMCHPGYGSTSLQYGHWGYLWEEELNALISAQVQLVIKSRAMRLTSFQEFCD